MRQAGTDPDIESRKPEASTWTIMRRLFAEAVVHKGVLGLAIALSIVGSTLALLAPLYVQSIVNTIAAARPFSEVAGDVAMLVLVTLLEAIITVANTYAMTWLGVQVMYAMRNDMFAHLQRLSFKYFATYKTGKIISYVTNDVETINVLISIGLVNVIVQLFQLAGSLAFMLALSPAMSVLVLLYMPLDLGLMVAFTRRSRRYYTAIRKAVASVTSQAQEGIDGFRTIKAFKTERAVLARFEHASRAELDANMAAASLWSAMPAAFTAITFTSIGSCVLLGGYLFLQGLVNVGLIFAFVMYIMMFLGPLGSIAQFASDIQNAVVGAGRVLRLLDVDVDMIEDERPVEPGTVHGEITFDDVHFAYEGDDVLKGITLTIRPNERVAIVGPTGAGKTTLAALIPRFFDVQRGSVSIDGVDVRRYRMAWLRKHVGLVLQDNFLFADTIRENIRYGRLDASDADIVAAAKAIGAHEFIEGLPNGYNTTVGERGAILSIGQRQLIAFARTILADPPVLILDEATSSVDAYSELLIQRSLDTLLKSRTSIIIAHRLSTVVNSDRIVVLDHGKVIETGTHESLLAAGGIYKKFHDMQFAVNRLPGAPVKT